MSNDEQSLSREAPSPGLSSRPERGEAEEPDVPLEIRVRWEIWHSFVSLLQSYAAAASLGGNEYTVDSFSDWAKVESQGRAVRFCFSPSTGEAVWRRVQPEMEAWGEFHIRQDGTFQFLGIAKPLDIAVIDWITWLGEKASFGNLTLDYSPDDSPTIKL